MFHSINVNGITNPDWIARFDFGVEAGRKWAIEQLHQGNGSVSSRKIRAHAVRAVSAFIAIQTGRLPSLTYTAIDDHQARSAMHDGFIRGVRSGTRSKIAYRR
jgi:hypothetical protein